MIAFLRRFQPQTPILAIVYWLAWLVAIAGALFLLFYFVDGAFDLSGRFFDPSVD